MNKSETIGQLAAALSKLQGECQDVFKSKQGYGYKYADLASILDITRPLCAKYELAVSQLCEGGCAVLDAQPAIGVETILMHSSGEWISSTFAMTVSSAKGMSAAQAAGSVITYARRYALAAILGIAQTDDDASLKGMAEKEPSLYDLVCAQVSQKKITAAVAKSWCEQYNVDRLSDLNDAQLNEILLFLAGK